MARLSSFFPALIGLIPSSVASTPSLVWRVETVRLKSRVGICLARSALFSTLQVGIFSTHVGVKIVLPLRQIRPVAYDFFGAQAVVLCQRNKSQMQVGCFLVHVYHCRHDIFLRPTRSMRKSAAPGKKACISLGTCLEKPGWRL